MRDLVYVLPLRKLSVGCSPNVQFLMARQSVLAGERSTAFFADEWLGSRVFGIDTLVSFLIV